MSHSESGTKKEVYTNAGLSPKQNKAEKSQISNLILHIKKVKKQANKTKKNK